MFDVVFTTPGSLGSNPRVVKAANACSEAGWTVAVVSIRKLEVVEPLDEDILTRSNWTSHRIDLRSRWRWRRYRLAEMISHFAPRAGNHETFAASIALRRRVMHLPARLYVGHYTAALPVVAEAAARHKAKFAFDAEDFHPGEFPDEALETRARKR